MSEYKTLTVLPQPVPAIQNKTKYVKLDQQNTITLYMWRLRYITILVSAVH